MPSTFLCIKANYFLTLFFFPFVLKDKEKTSWVIFSFASFYFPALSLKRDVTRNSYIVFLQWYRQDFHSGSTRNFWKTLRLLSNSTDMKDSQHKNTLLLCTPFEPFLKTDVTDGTCFCKYSPCLYPSRSSRQDPLGLHRYK